MTNITQADIEAVKRFHEESARWILDALKGDGRIGEERDLNHPIYQAFAAHRIAAEKETKRRIVEWLRDDASLTEIEARRILGNLITLTPADTEAWAKLIAMKHGIKDAIERGDYKETNNG